MSDPGPAADRPETPANDDESWPIGFLIIVTLAVLYLGWRLVQGVGWLISNLT